MDDDVETLVLAPFHEIVEKGKMALANATEAGLTKADDMFKAAQTLVRDGERAVGKLEPLCRKKWEEYSTNFVAALVENDEIAHFRTELNDQLWDFESFVEVDDFDASEYSKLRHVLKQAIKRIPEILIRMKLEPPPMTFASFDSAGISRTTSAAGRSFVSDMPLQSAETPETIDEETADAEQAQGLSHPVAVMTTQAGPDEGYEPKSASPEDGTRPESPVIPHRLYPEPGIPAAPLTNPWDPTARPPVFVVAEQSEARPPPDRRRRVSSEDSGRPFTPPFVNSNAFGEPEGARPRRLDHGIEVWEGMTRGAEVARPTNSGHSSMFDPGGRESMVSPSTGHCLSVQDEYSASQVRNTSHASIPEHVSVMSWAPPTRKPVPVRPEPSGGTQPRAEADVPSPPREHVDQEGGGLILAQEQEQEQEGLEAVVNATPPPLAPREPDCRITVESSFYQQKGFCSGAKAITRGGIGVKKVRKGGIGTANYVAQCTNKNCMFELSGTAVEADEDRSDANFRNSGIGFRLRFISKSHLLAGHIDDHKYGCLFCIQDGRTPDESDATVFPNQKALFSHLARHPRPLPHVPGLTVIESAEVPQQYRNNYDLHLPGPPARSRMIGLTRELSGMPTALATEGFMRSQLRVLRTPPDGTATLQFYAGQRIVGIEFPERFGGDWAVGWADNVRGAFPADCVKLEAPPECEVLKQGGSRMRAMARWKRHPKEKEVKEGGWLRFEKGEVIANITYAYAEHWCWFGSNSKGKYGIFPQSHLEPNTLSETPSGDRASIISAESRTGASRILNKASFMRRRETRPVSSAGSHSSGETATHMSPRPSMYS